MTTPELLPCPFCGAVQPPHDDTSWIRCSGCGAETGWRADGAGAIAAWNRRTPSPEVAALIAEARREGWKAAIEAAEKACDPSSYQAHHASVRRRCQAAIRALKEETP